MNATTRQDMTQVEDTGLPAPPESGKRKNIIDGARRVFRAEGFDGASMDKIAQAARVSKGTLYVYFRSKEELFQELVMVDRGEAAERVFELGDHEAEVEAVLLRLGERFMTLMTSPQHVALSRMVMGAAEKFPEVGRTFFEMGPCYGIRTLAGYLEEQAARGRLEFDEDSALVAAHFLNLCHGNLLKALLFGLADTPTEAQISATIESAVRVFMRAYGPRADDAAA